MREKNAHLWARDPLDFYTEPEWTSERLFQQVKFPGPIYDPACGLGRIVKAAREAEYQCEGSDLMRRSKFCDFEADFLSRPIGSWCPGTIICNPPFKYAQAFVKRALQVAEYEVAMLLPAKWRSSDKRSRWLETTPLWMVLDITPRPSMPPGAVIEAGEKPGGGREDFAWYLWKKNHTGPYQGGWLRRDG